MAIPDKAFTFGYNEAGDYLFLLPSERSPEEFDNKVYVYWHEEDKFELYNNDI